MGCWNPCVILRVSQISAFNLAHKRSRNAAKSPLAAQTLVLPNMIEKESLA